jgi:hypothetical protein
MSSDWIVVDTLIRDLGATRVAADAAHVNAAAKAVIEQAIREAAEAVAQTFEEPVSRRSVEQARGAIGVALDVIAALHGEIERSRRLRGAAAALTGRAKDLVEQAARPRPEPAS